jgi:hypothetical protein
MATKKKQPEPVAVKDRWFLPSNHYNLMSWQSAGMVLPHHNMEKYYPDCTEISPGWIPVFLNRIPQQARDAATSRSGHFALLEIDISKFSGLVFGVTYEGDLKEINLPLADRQDMSSLFIPAPLPATCIASVTFETPAARDSYLERSSEISNIPANAFHIGIGKCPMTADDFAAQSTWPPKVLPEPLPVFAVDSISAQGASAALLFAFGNLNDDTVDACRLAFEACIDGLFTADSPFRKRVDQLMSFGIKPTIAELRSRLFWGVVERIVKPPEVDGSPSDAGFAVLHFLEQESAAELPIAGKFQELIDDLRGASGLARYTHKELFEKHPGPFSHALLLFFLRQHSDELLEFAAPDFSVTTIDKIAAAILFASRDGWQGIPQAVHETSGIYAAVVQRMALAAHKLAHTNLDLGTPPARCQPLRELLAPKGGKLSKQQNEASISLARKLDWPDVIETRIRVGKGEYRLEVGSGGFDLILPGEVKAVESTVATESLLRHLSQQIGVPAKVDLEVRKILGMMVG